MWIRNGFLVALTVLFTSALAPADEVFVKGQAKPTRGSVRSESAKEVTLDKGEPLAGAAVLDIHYDNVKPVDLNLSGGAYKNAKNAEKEADEAANAIKRSPPLQTAINQYAATLKSMDKSNTSATRHFEYKIALLTYQKAANDKLPTDQALAKLQSYKSRYANSWQINHVMPLIAQIQSDNQDFKAAEQTYEEMAGMAGLPDDVRRDSELKVVRIRMRSGSYDQAGQKLDALAKKAGNNALLASRIKLLRAELLTSQKKIDEALPLVQQVIKETSDRQIKAFAHNTLGECLFKANRFNEAIWEFLWVDAVYNQDKEQRAKALYYLWKTFDQLNNAERAQQCREALLSDARYAGTEYQHLGQTQVK